MKQSWSGCIRAYICKLRIIMLQWLKRLTHERRKPRWISLFIVHCPITPNNPDPPWCIFPGKMTTRARPSGSRTCFRRKWRPTATSRSVKQHSRQISGFGHSTLEAVQPASDQRTAQIQPQRIHHRFQVHMPRLSSAPSYSLAAFDQKFPPNAVHRTSCHR